MAFNPNLPQDDSLMMAGQMRDQFNALNNLIQTTLPGPQGPQGEQGLQGEQGPPGEVTTQDLNSALAQVLTEAAGASSANSNGVPFLEITIENPPTQGNVQALMDRVNELINALRR